MNKSLTPKLWSILRKDGYSFTTFYKDLIAGIVVGIIALPMCIAYAVASGARPEQGLITAILAGFFGSLLGGSRLQISGPTGAFITIIYAIIQQHGYDGLVIATFMAGIILIVMGFSKFGTAMKFVSYPVIIGFTTGIALLIFTGQIKDFLGLPIQLPPSFVDKWALYFKHFSEFDPTHVIIGASTILIVLLWPRYVTTKIPGSLVAIIFFTFLVGYYQIPVETLFDRFGPMPCELPTCFLMQLDWSDLPDISSLVSPAISIALLAGIESLLAAVIAQGISGGRYRSNVELIGQGVANIACSLGGGIPATGAIARTVTNINNGAQTPMAGIFHSLVIFGILFAFAPAVNYIPFPVLAGMLMTIAYNMSEWRVFVGLFKAPKSDIAVMLTTFILTVFVDLVVAIQAGVIISAFLFMNRMSEASYMKDLRQALDEEDQDDEPSLKHIDIPNEVDVFEIHGSLFFGAAEKFKNALLNTNRKPKVLIIEMRHVLSIDASGMQVLKELHHECKNSQIVLLFSGMKPEIRQVLRNAGFIQEIGEEAIYPDTRSALNRAKELLSQIT